MKLTKPQIKSQEACEELLKKDTLTYDEKIYVYENWHEGATNTNSVAGAFFTPFGLARDFHLELYDKKKTIDLCAGIGMLSFIAYHWNECHDITCVEYNSDYVRVGKKLLPEANWICGSIFDIVDDDYEQAISNPPFGKIKTGISDIKLKYKGAEFDLKAIEIASKISSRASFILPQGSTPFKYSGARYYEDLRDTDSCSNKVKKFIKETGIDYEFNCGIDTSYYLNEWKGVSPLCEIVNFDFE
jgi:hypothetical protein